MATNLVFEALAAPHRREILRLVWDRERSAGDIHRAVSTVSFGAVSQHLKVLESTGLVAGRQEGRFRFDAGRRRELGCRARWLETMWDENLGEWKRHAEKEERERKSRRRRRR